MSALNEILSTSYEVDNNRTQYDVLAKVMEEVGELACEVAIGNGGSYKTAGSDGIIGEAVDVIITATDLIYLTNPWITEDDLMDIIKTKLAKWKSKLGRP